MSKALTQRQIELLHFLRDFKNDNGYMPTTREIQDHFGFASQTAAMGHIRALERKGLIERKSNAARAIVLVEGVEKRMTSLDEKIAAYRADFELASGGWFPADLDYSESLEADESELKETILNNITVFVTFLLQLGLNADEELDKHLARNLDRVKRATEAATLKGTTVKEEYPNVKGKLS